MFRSSEQQQPIGSDGLPLPRPDNNGYGFQDEVLGPVINPDCCFKTNESEQPRKKQRKGRGKGYTTAHLKFYRCKCGNSYTSFCQHRKAKTIRDRHEEVEARREQMIIIARASLRRQAG